MLLIVKMGIWKSQNSQTSQPPSPEKSDPKENVVYQQTKPSSRNYIGLNKIVLQSYLQGQVSAWIERNILFIIPSCSS